LNCCWNGKGTTVLLACSPFKEMTKLHSFLLLSFACRRTLQSIQEMTKLHFVLVAFLLLAEE
jgi:hypothetical protein